MVLAIKAGTFWSRRGVVSPRTFARPRSKTGIFEVLVALGHGDDLIYKARSSLCRHCLKIECISNKRRVNFKVEFQTRQNLTVGKKENKESMSICQLGAYQNHVDLKLEIGWFLTFLWIIATKSSSFLRQVTFSNFDLGEKFKFTFFFKSSIFVFHEQSCR